MRQLAGWYFNKRVLPYWCLLLMDALTVFAACLFAYWVSNRTGSIFDNRFAVVYTALLYAALSWVGARAFKTYAGVVRYSSFVDLMKVACANGVTLALALVSQLLLRTAGVTALASLSPLETVATIAISTLLMWGMRVAVKIMFDDSAVDDTAKRALVYGALSGGGRGQIYPLATAGPVRTAGLHHPREAHP